MLQGTFKYRVHLKLAQRQGFAEQKKKQNDKNQDKPPSNSSRCGCKWSCRIVGMKQTPFTQSQIQEKKELSDQDLDMVWFLTAPETVHLHNHTCTQLNKETRSQLNKSRLEFDWAMESLVLPIPYNLTPPPRSSEEKKLILSTMDPSIELLTRITPRFKLFHEWSPLSFHKNRPRSTL